MKKGAAARRKEKRNVLKKEGETGIPPKKKSSKTVHAKGRD